MRVPIGEIYAWFLLFLRGGAILSLTPFFSGRSIPNRMRLAIAMVVALCLSPLIQPSSLQLPKSSMSFYLAFGKEVIVGLLMGMSIRIVFATVEFAGHLISNEISLTRSESLNPFGTDQTSAIGTLLFYFGVFLFFITGMHREMLTALLRSYEIVPAGDLRHSLRGFDCLLRQTSNIFVLGFRMAAPILALNFIINMVFSVLGKAAPKINVFVISFATRILAGLLLFYLTLKLILQYLYNAIIASPRGMLELLVN